MAKNKFGKVYKLCNKKTIDELFESGTRIKSFPFVLIVKEVVFEDPLAFKIGFSAPKKNFRFAHSRNRIKRLSKEAVRLNKNTLEAYLHDKKKQLALFLIYSSSEELSYSQLNKNLETIFNKIIQKLENNEIINPT